MIDALQELSQEQVLTSSSADSTNTINFGAATPFSGGAISQG